MIQPSPAPPYLWALRITVLVHAGMLALSFVTAGQLLMEDVGALPVRATTAIGVHVSGGAQLVAAALLARPGRGPLWPAVDGAAAFAVRLVHAYFGHHQLLG